MFLLFPRCDPQCGEYHDGSSCSVRIPLFVQYARMFLRFLVPDLDTLLAAEMPTRGTAEECILTIGHRTFGSVEVPTSPT